MENGDRLIVVMGVSGSGKSTVGAALAARLGARFVEADDFHSAKNREKMTAGAPLSDADRGPWMDAVCGALEGGTDPVTVLACSALTELVQGRLAALNFGRTDWIHLDVARGALERRMRERDHFMPATLLGSQFDALTVPPGAVTVNGQQEISALVDEIVRKTRTGSGR